MTTTQTFQPGDVVLIRVGTVHAPDSLMAPREARQGVVERVMAGGAYVIVHAEEWGTVYPARNVRVRIEDLTLDEAGA